MRRIDERKREELAAPGGNSHRSPTASQSTAEAPVRTVATLAECDRPRCVCIVNASMLLSWSHAWVAVSAGPDPAAP